MARPHVPVWSHPARALTEAFRNFGDPEYRYADLSLKNLTSGELNFREQKGSITGWTQSKLQLILTIQ
jgi:hypothetical protein